MTQQEPEWKIRLKKEYNKGIFCVTAYDYPLTDAEIEEHYKRGIKVIRVWKSA